MREKMTGAIVRFELAPLVPGLIVDPRAVHAAVEYDSAKSYDVALQRTAQHCCG